MMRLTLMKVTSSIKALCTSPAPPNATRSDVLAEGLCKLNLEVAKGEVYSQQERTP